MNKIIDSFIDTGEPPSPGEPKPTEAWTWLRQMTGVSAAGFVYQPNNIRWQQKVPDAVDRLACGYPDPTQRTFDLFADDLPDFPMHLDLWSISSLELIGLWRPSPIVFEHVPKGMGPASMHRVKTRDVNPQERDAIEKIRDHAQLVASFDAEKNNIRMVGAIRAGKACLECHDTQVGALLGAFTYRFEQIPYPEDLVTPAEPAHVVAFPRIKELGGYVRIDEKNHTIYVGLSFEKITDDDIEIVKDLKWLEGMNVMFTKVKGPGLRHLKGLPRLRWLNLHGSEISDASLSYVSELKNLEVLDLTATNITDAGLVQLLQLPKLEKLNLYQSKTTDHGIENLAKMTNLRELKIGETGVTLFGMKKLQAALPMCDIQF